MKTLKTRSICLAVVLSSAGVAAAQHHHEGDVIVARTDAGSLAIEFDAGTCNPLAPVSPPLRGWSGDEPGFEALEADEPDEGLFMLAPSSDVWIEAISLDPGLRAWRNDLSASMTAPGQRVNLGGADLHTHLIWNVDPLLPGFDPGAGQWQGTFKLVDLGTTGYGESVPFTLCFTNVPEPSALVLLTFGMVTAGPARRRQRR